MLSNLLGGVSAAGVGLLTYLAWPGPAFLKVHELRVVGDQVISSRSVPEPGGIANWAVVVVGDGIDAPSCQTIPGPSEHQGWSRYEPAEADQRSMHLDIWVGYVGCYDKLTPGE